MSSENPFSRTRSYTVGPCSFSLLFVSLTVITLFRACTTPRVADESQDMYQRMKDTPATWLAPDTSAIPRTTEGELIRYGRKLIEHTSVYLGPSGKVARISNGMNCQNCHLSAGTKPYGNNYAYVASTYPRFRARSGTIESVEKRINDCIERSLNGVALADSSIEMKAMKAYILWVGQNIPDGLAPLGGGLEALPFLDRAANPNKGETVFRKHCVRCHGPQGKGRRVSGKAEWLYPPLVGDSSYNIGAGLYRVSRFASFVRNNMPEGTTYLNPVLTVEEAWDVAAYINSLPRPVKDFSLDWPDISRKPADHPFGPYADSLTEHQHKYGPFIHVQK